VKEGFIRDTINLPDMPTYKLTYFNGRGRAEISRLIFAQAGVKYEDVRVKDEWPELKPKTPWGSLPFLEVDGKKLGQSLTVARFLAREFGLAGKSVLEQAQADAIVDAVTDLFDNAVRTHFEKDEAKKATLQKKLAEEQVPQTLTNLEKQLGSNQYFVGNKVTWADLHFMNVIAMFKSMNAEVLSKFPKLDALEKRVCALPNIKKWLETRPETSM